MSRTPLAEKLRRLIEANGPMTVAQYMAHCLTDPEHGYYVTRDPLGRSGDFITAPEVSQMFGEILGGWLIHVWDLCGAPSPVSLVELGPGRGTLMADILRVASRVPKFGVAAHVRLVEASPVLKARQADALKDSSFPLSWHASLDEIPPGPMLLVANEFFDALPIRQYQRIAGEWRERVVSLDAAGELAFGIGPGRLANGPVASEGATLEVSEPAEALVDQIAERIATDGGAALIIDYGNQRTAGDPTLQAVRGHRYTDPLAAPGEADLTAHVDFGALARRAIAEGAAVHGPMPQGEFLLALGLLDRAGRLGSDADEATRDQLRAAVERLAEPYQMGDLFKMLAITQVGIAPPPFSAALGDKQPRPICAA